MKILGYPLGWIMYGIYNFCKSYGLSLIIFAILTKAILLPLNIKSQQSAAKMRALNPKLEKIKKSFSNNPQRIQEEQMKLQNEEGVNPMAGCLPALIQFPILFGIVDVVYKPLTHILRFSKETLSAAHDILEKIPDVAKQDLSQNYQELAIIKYATDPSYSSYFSEMGNDFISKINDFQDHNMFLGYINLATKADFHPQAWTAGAVALIIIPILSGIVNLATTLISQIHQKKTNPAMATMGSMNLTYGSHSPSLQVPLSTGQFQVFSDLYRWSHSTNTTHRKDVKHFLRPTRKRIKTENRALWQSLWNSSRKCSLSRTVQRLHIQVLQQRHAADFPSLSSMKKAEMPSMKQER